MKVRKVENETHEIQIPRYKHLDTILTNTQVIKNKRGNFNKNALIQQSGRSEELQEAKQRNSTNE